MVVSQVAVEFKAVACAGDELLPHHGNEKKKWLIFGWNGSGDGAFLSLVTTFHKSRKW